MEENGDEWTGRVEISKEEIPDSRRSLLGLLQALEREPLSSRFSTDETLISVSAVLRCGE